MIATIMQARRVSFLKAHLNTIFKSEGNNREFLQYRLSNTVNARQKLGRGLAAVLRETLFLGRTVTLTGFIFELVELHGQIHFSVL